MPEHDPTSRGRGAAIAAAEVADLPEVARLADRIWREHYPGIIPMRQIDYMLERGYSIARLSRFLSETGAGLAIASVGGARVGFAAWERDGPGTTKLDKLYVLASAHGRGVGRTLVGHVEAAALADGSATLTLRVNKQNASSIAFYRAVGFGVDAETVEDIGGGFVMDDYVMAKPLRRAEGARA